MGTHMRQGIAQHAPGLRCPTEPRTCGWFEVTYTALSLTPGKAQQGKSNNPDYSRVPAAGTQSLEACPSARWSTKVPKLPPGCSGDTSVPKPHQPCCQPSPGAPHGSHISLLPAADEQHTENRIIRVGK